MEIRLVRGPRGDSDKTDDKGGGDFSDFSTPLATPPKTVCSPAYDDGIRHDEIINFTSFRHFSPSGAAAAAAAKDRHTDEHTKKNTLN